MDPNQRLSVYSLAGCFSVASGSDELAVLELDVGQLGRAPRACEGPVGLLANGQRSKALATAELHRDFPVTRDTIGRPHERRLGQQQKTDNNNGPAACSVMYHLIHGKHP